jgi:hypothetical protein
MMAPEVYEQARADAPIHVQIWRPRIQSSPPRIDVVRVEGRIVRIFRNQGGVVRWGQKVTFTVPVISPNGPPRTPMPGADIRHKWERIGPSRCLEAFLEAWDGEIQLVRSQVAPIRRPSLRPICGPTVKGFVCPGNL